MRLYVALHPPRQILSALAEAIDRATRAYPGLPWTARAQWHLTLSFYGEVDAPAVETLKGLLAETAATWPAPSLSLVGSGTFPVGTAGQAKILWTGVEGDLANLAELAERCAMAGRQARLELPERNFHPHLTVVRDADRFHDLRGPAELLHGFAGDSWTPGTLDLMLSHFPQPGSTRLEAMAFTEQ